MANAAQVKIGAAVDKLVADGQRFIPGMIDSYVNAYDMTGFSQEFAQWQTECRHALSLLGTHAAAFQPAFQARGDSMGRASEMLGSMQALQAAIKNDLLVSAESLLRAEVFSDLLEQAEYLQDRGMFLAAGVIARAVLEDHLRSWCHRASCVPAQPKPTLDNFKTALYPTHLSLADMKHVEAMAAIGNEAAHNKPTLTEANVRRFISDVRDFIKNHPLP